MNETQIRANIVAFAKKHVGTTTPKGDDKFIAFYNNLTGNKFPLDGTAWCAIFQTYIHRQNEVPLTALPNFHSCTWLRNTFLIPHKRWRPARAYTPKPGDLILFNWDGKTTVLNHVGIVEKVVGGVVYTLEGNAGQVSGVRSKTYNLSSKVIIGYGELDYSDMEYGGEIDPEVPVIKDNLIKNVQEWFNGFQNINVSVDGSFGPMTKIGAIKVLQTILNRDNYGTKLTIDGSFGPATKDVMSNAAVKRGNKNDIVKLAQGLLYARYYNPQGFDGMFGPGLQFAVKEYQKAAGLKVDGSIGPATMESLCTKW